jgi:hypothetical protein
MPIICCNWSWILRSLTWFAHQCFPGTQVLDWVCHGSWIHHRVSSTSLLPAFLYCPIRLNQRWSMNTDQLHRWTSGSCRAWMWRWTWSSWRWCPWVCRNWSCRRLHEYRTRNCRARSCSRNKKITIRLRGGPIWRNWRNCSCRGHEIFRTCWSRSSLRKRWCSRLPVIWRS